MIDRKPVPIFWDYNYPGTTIKNFGMLKDCLANGYEIERVDRVDDNTLMYIIAAEFDDEESEND